MIQSGSRNLKALGRVTEVAYCSYNYLAITNCLTGDTYARCTLCLSDFSVSHGGRNDVTTHVNGKHHKGLAVDASTTRSVTSFFKPEVAKSVITAETRWAMFVVKHN